MADLRYVTSRTRRHGELGMRALCVMTGIFLALYLAIRPAPAQDVPPMMQDWSPDRYEIFCGEHKKPHPQQFMGVFITGGTWGDADAPDDAGCLDARRRGFIESTSQWFTKRYRATNYHSPLRFGPVIESDGADARMRVYAKDGVPKGIAQVSLSCHPADIWLMQVNPAALGRFPKNVLTYIMGHELMHLVQGSYPGWLGPRPDQKGNCTSPPQWITEGIADAISIGETRRIFPAFYPPHPDQEAAESWAGLRPWYRALHDDTIANKLRYRTSGFWRHLAEGYHRGSYHFLQSYMLQRPPKLGNGAEDWLAWLDQNLRNDPKIKLPLYLIFPSFATEFASLWTKGEAGEKFGRGRWLTEAFEGCYEADLTPEAPYQEIEVALRPLAARCLTVRVKGVDPNDLIAVKIGALTVSLEEAEELHLGLAYTNDATGYTCTRDGKPIRDRGSLGCVMKPETGTFKAGTQDITAARIWPPTPQEVGSGSSNEDGQQQGNRRSGLKNVYVLSRVPPKPSRGNPNTFPYEDKTYKIAVGLDSTTLTLAGRSVNKGGENGKRRSKRRRAAGTLGMSATETDLALFPTAGHTDLGPLGGALSGISEMAANLSGMAANMRMALPGMFILADAKVIPRRFVSTPERLEIVAQYTVMPQKPLSLGMVGRFKGSVMGQSKELGDGILHLLKAKTTAQIDVTVNSKQAFVATVSATMCEWNMRSKKPRCVREFNLKGRIVKSFAGMYYPEGVLTTLRTPGQALYEEASHRNLAMILGGAAGGGGDSSDGSDPSAVGGGGGQVATLPDERASIALEAIDGEGGGQLSDPGLRWTVLALANGARVLSNAAEIRPLLTLSPGRYIARASLGGRIGEIQFQVAGAGAATHQVALAAEAPAPASPASAGDQQQERYRAILEAQGLPESVRDMMLDDFANQAPETRQLIIEHFSKPGGAQ